MSERILHFYTCNICGEEKQGPQSWAHYGVVDLNNRHRIQGEYVFKIHICHKCYSLEVPTLTKTVLNWMLERLRLK